MICIKSLRIYALLAHFLLTFSLLWTSMDSITVSYNDQSDREEQMENYRFAIAFSVVCLGMQGIFLGMALNRVTFGSVILLFLDCMGSFFTLWVALDGLAWSTYAVVATMCMWVVMCFSIDFINAAWLKFDTSDIFQLSVASWELVCCLWEMWSCGPSVHSTPMLAGWRGSARCSHFECLSCIWYCMFALFYFLNTTPLWLFFSHASIPLSLHNTLLYIRNWQNAPSVQLSKTNKLMRIWEYYLHFLSGCLNEWGVWSPRTQHFRSAVFSRQLNVTKIRIFFLLSSSSLPEQLGEKKSGNYPRMPSNTPPVNPLPVGIL